MSAEYKSYNGIKSYYNPRVYVTTILNTEILQQRDPLKYELLL